MIGARFPTALTKAIDEWAAENGDIGRSEAMRRLVERGLKAKGEDSQIFQLLPWRGPRDERDFPLNLVRGGPQEWPWAPATNVYLPEWGS